MRTADRIKGRSCREFAVNVVMGNVVRNRFANKPIGFPGDIYNNLPILTEKLLAGPLLPARTNPPSFRDSGALSGRIRRIVALEGFPKRARISGEQVEKSDYNKFTSPS